MSAEGERIHEGRGWCGRFPKVGIRPVIDGRVNGIRENLEEQTMSMAQSAAEFISNNIKYPDGTAVQCVIAASTIGGVVEAISTDYKFSQEGVGVSLTVTPSWCFSAETIDTKIDIPKAIWGFNATERPGAVYLASALASYNQKGYPTFSIYGRDVQDKDDTEITPDVQEKIIRFVKSALAVKLMEGNSYLSLGGTSMGIAGSMVDLDFFEDYLGMRVEFVDMVELVRRIDQKIYDEAEFKKAISWVKKNCKEGLGRSELDRSKTREQLDQDWETCVKMFLATRDMMIGNPNLDKKFSEEALGHNAICGGFQGQRQWTDHFPNGDFMEAFLNSSFDWNGIRAPFVFATENDSLNGACMLFGYLLTNTPSLFADVRTYWSPDAVKRVTGYTLTDTAEKGFIHLINSGACTLDATGELQTNNMPVMKPYWEITQPDVDNCLKATTWYPAQLDAFRGGGFSSGYLTKGGIPFTMTRLNIIKGLGPVLNIAEGWTIDLPENVADHIINRTDPTWPTHFFAPRLTGAFPFDDVYNVMNNWGANHGALSYGHIGSDLITLASMLRIPVGMHNIPNNKVYRPSVWSAFGTNDIESADYRACKTFGPLFGKTRN